MPMQPFSLELVFSGLCLFHFNEQGANVLLVNAADPKVFDEDPDFDGLDPLTPRPHFPTFSYLVTQQVRQGVPYRRPDSVFAGPSGEEIGVCDLTGEELALDVADGKPFQPGSLGDAPQLSSLLNTQLNPLCFSSLPNSAVAARFQVRRGSLDTLSLAFTGVDLLLVDFQTTRHKGEPSGIQPRPIADQLVLRIDNLTEPVAIRSDSKQSILLSPDVQPSNRDSRKVVATLANYHRQFHPPRDAAYDFLWFYELLDFSTVQKPSRLDLKIPVYRNTPGGFTGSSAVCPPIRA